MNYVIKHAECDLYIAERAGSWARWGGLGEALQLTREEWEKVLAPDRRMLVFVEAGAKEGEG